MFGEFVPRKMPFVDADYKHCTYFNHAGPRIDNKHRSLVRVVRTTFHNRKYVQFSFPHRWEFVDTSVLKYKSTFNGSGKLA